MISKAAKASADITALIERGQGALTEAASRPANAHGVIAAAEVHRDLVAASDAISAALVVVRATYWPVGRDYEDVTLKLV
jgi:hypothetical protein